MKIIIVGGGIGGLAAYHALRIYLPSNVSIKVYKSHPTPKTATSFVGGGIGIFPNGLRALNAISPSSVLYLRAHGNTSPYFVVRNQNGTTLGRLGGVQDRILLPRASAHESLLLDIPDGVVEWGRKAIEVRETADAAQVVFEDGTIETCDLIIGADGVKSVCRQALFGEEAYRLQYDTTTIGSFAPFVSLTRHACPSEQRKGRPGSYDSQSQWILYVCPFSAYKYIRQRATSDVLVYVRQQYITTSLPGFRRHTRHPYAEAWPMPLRLGPLPPTHASRNGLFYLAAKLPLPYWSSLHGTTKGAARIILVGDAAHPATPDSGQDEALPKVAKAYEDLRIPRIEKINNLGKRYLNGNHELSWFKAAVRDLMIWVMCHLPLRVMLWINPTHLYDGEKEAARYLAAMA
ncbi:hypothetical protein EV421DRAFT_1996087 [Armillaria borealis]|uniref:FAD/NAD(P)-binding domain-containing protein n=1 Tax=Armillaria borealis TaxID=47425 RepID=A0AA39JV14_9AGAR|nr:hypothetical protein EV421DRAFT_1996087 [Armillaria borealis]